MGSSFSETDVVEYLENCVKQRSADFVYIDLEHPYVYTADSRITLFADPKRWAIVFERSGFNPRGGRFELNVFYYGNCLCNLPAGTRPGHHWNCIYIDLIPEGLEESEESFQCVTPKMKRVRIRGQYVDLPINRKEYAKWLPDQFADGIPEEITFWDLGRYLAFEHRDLCRATASELQTCLPPDLPQLMQIDEWHHREYFYIDEVPPNATPYLPNGRPATIGGEKPGDYETYPLIAKVLVARDPSLFKPTLAPNNHWSNWPEAGAL